MQLPPKTINEKLNFAVFVMAPSNKMLIFAVDRIRSDYKSKRPINYPDTIFCLTWRVV